ncbi:MFS transporter [Acidithiobacillus thiooxidans]|uniref:MFS transporter n=1 Tax=Acidithiobacillus thiooxidans TaxID=930 RepID=UPI00286485FA|nr:MFS transporter [Acidithiobacillus thiooxidans]MDR7926579.1 MFS transporter [Acidithiobacillus thiooxidans]
MNTIGGLPQSAKLLLAAKAARSVGQGALVVDFALYLHALGWSAVDIGGLYSGSLIFGAVAILTIGPASDRYGARRFLQGYELLQISCAITAIFSASPWLLGGAAILGTFGHGAAGGAGPFSPAEQSWLSRTVNPVYMGFVFRWNAGIGFFGMGIGALMGGIPDYFAHEIPTLMGFRIIFILVFIGALMTWVLLYFTEEQRSMSVPPKVALTEEFEPHTENRIPPPWKTLFTLFGINALNGVEIGMIGPLMAYWFAIRFGVGPAAIGEMMGAAFMSAGIMSIVAGRLVARWGPVSTVLFFRTSGLVMLILIPLMPYFGLAVVCFVLRATFNQGSLGSRQSLFLSLVPQQHRGLAATFNSVSIQIPRAIGPSIAGSLMQMGLLSAPFFIAAGFQGLYILLYGRFFQSRQARSCL